MASRRVAPALGLVLLGKQLCLAGRPLPGLGALHRSRLDLLKQRFAHTRLGIVARRVDLGGLLHLLKPFRV